MELKYIKPTVKLFDNQVNNVKGLLQRRRALLTDKVGGGKTLSILYAFAVLKERGKLSNMLVLTPLSAYEKVVWKKDIQKFTNFKCIDLEDLAKMATSPERLTKCLEQYDIIYGKHSHVRNNLPLIESLCKVEDMMLAIDEVHAFRNPKSNVTLALRQAASFTKSFWGISGSSLSKSLEDVYNIINLIYPWYLGAFTHFREKYCVTREKVIGTFNGKRRKALEIVGVKDEVAFEEKLAPIIIKGQSFVEVKYHYIDYNVEKEDQEIYRKIANGIDLKGDMDSADWFRFLMEENTEEHVPQIKSVEKHSSRFVYLQAAADGILNSDGTQTKQNSIKTRILIDKIREIVSKGQSVIVYFDYYASLYIIDSMLKEANLRCKILHSTGEHVLTDQDVTEGKCKQIPHVILGTRASSESASYYFINNVIFFHIPTVPSTMIQLIGRITRKNTLYPDDLNCYIFRSENIDLYKLMVVSAKTYQLELTQGEERNIPPDYKRAMSKNDSLDRMKKLLLWQK